METEPIPQEAWSLVEDKAMEIADAAMRADEDLVAVYIGQMHDLLDGVEAEFGNHAMLLAARADFLPDNEERRSLQEVALILAKERGNETEVAEIVDSLRTLPD